MAILWIESVLGLPSSAKAGTTVTGSVFVMNIDSFSRWVALNIITEANVSIDPSVFPSPLLPGQVAMFKISFPMSVQSMHLSIAAQYLEGDPMYGGGWITGDTREVDVLVEEVVIPPPPPGEGKIGFGFEQPVIAA